MALEDGEIESRGNPAPPEAKQPPQQRMEIGEGGGLSRAASAGSIPSVVLTPEKKALALMIKAFIFAERLPHVTDQLFLVYLVAIVGFTPLLTSYLVMAKKAVSIVFKPLVADVVDRVKFHKWTILYIVSLIKVASGICMATSTSLGVLFFKFVIDGVQKFGDSAKTAMTLGTVGKTRFHKKYAASNMLTELLGVITGTVILTLVSFFVWPNVKNIFWSVVIVGALMMVCVALMPRHSLDGTDTVDHRIARGRSVFRLDVARMPSVQSISRSLLFDESDDEAADEGGDWQPVSRRNVTGDSKGLAAPGYTQVMTYKELYADPKRRRSLILLSLVYFSWHFVNAITTPLLGQYMAINASDPKYGLPITAILVLINQVSRFLVVGAWSGGRATRMGYTNVLLIGSAVLCLRMVSISLLVTYHPNYWALGATQILDGIGGGSMNLMSNLYSHLLSRRTGHFNLNMAVVLSAKELGDFLSYFAGGAIATLGSYNEAFYVLAAASVLPGIFAFFISTPDLKKI